jgi:hypothetical protein
MTTQKQQQEKNNVTEALPITNDEPYRGTVFLPKTDFPMRGNLPEREPGMGHDKPLWPDPGIVQGTGKIYPPHRPALCQWGYAFGPCHQQHLKRCHQ